MRTIPQHRASPTGHVHPALGNGIVSVSLCGRLGESPQSSIFTMGMNYFHRHLRIWAIDAKVWSRIYKRVLPAILTSFLSSIHWTLEREHATYFWIWWNSQKTASGLVTDKKFVTVCYVTRCTWCLLRLMMCYKQNNKKDCEFESCFELCFPGKLQIIQRRYNFNILLGAAYHRWIWLYPVLSRIVW